MSRIGASAWCLTSALCLALGAGLLVGGNLRAQQSAIKRTDLLKTDLAGMEGKEMNIWTADIAPGGATGRHQHPTPRFVVVLDGAVTLEIDGRPPQTFKAGEAFQETPGLVHNFKNASTTLPAKAIGIQYVDKGQPLQTDAR
jgi:quercetin dioxygenase-like cupin family protein